MFAQTYQMITSEIGCIHNFYVLNSAEDRLERLEGRNKRNLTSKDILHSLSESKEDHFRQLDTTVPSNSLESRDERTTGSDHHTQINDPWNATPSSSSAQDQHRDTEHSLDFEDSLEAEDTSTTSCFSKMTHVCLCWERRRSQQRRLQSVGSNLTAEEEEDFLMDCDQLGITFKKTS